MKALSLYFRFFRIHILSGLEYQGWWLTVLQALLYCILDPLGMLLLFLRFGNIGVWSVERLLLLYAMAVASYGLALCFCQGFNRFSGAMIRTGNFDRLLLRPKSLFLQAAGSAFYISRFSRPAAGLAVMLWCLWRQSVSLSPVNVLVLLMALTGGFAVYAGVLVMSSGIAFFTVNALDWIAVFTNASCQTARIPYEYMPRALKYIFTFLMPMLVVSYYPASFICGWGGSIWMALLALPTGLMFFAVSILVWRFGIRHYQSTGS